MTHLCRAAAATIAVISLLAAGTTGTAADKAAKQVVVAELFTSEGCSSCPPAEALLRHWSEEQPMEGVEIIALEEHVDYWNHLGWTDPFSSKQFSDRQEQYTSVFHNGGVYTPQLVIDGSAEIVGSRTQEAEEIIQRAASLPKASIELKETGARKNGHAAFQFSTASMPTALSSHKLELWVAVTERGLESDVRAGENSGRRLQHAALVRSLRKLETGDSAAQFQPQINVQLKGSWKQENLAVVVFLVDAASRRIVGVASQRVSRVDP